MKTKHRLSVNIKPTQYHIKIQPNLVDFNFVGSEVILIEISKATKQLVLHAAEIKLDTAELISGKEVINPKITYQNKAETVTLSFPKLLSGKVKLKLNFSGIINDQLRGLYRSRYLHNGQTKHLAVSQFEATDARRMIPCFDEPAHKSKFILEVVVPKDLQTVSNTVPDKITPHLPGYKIVRFKPTPNMSSYLLALIVGELEHLQGSSKRKVKIRVHTTPGKKAQAKFALDFTKQALDYLENYFGIKYPLPVLDLLAIPDFSAGAMENWGAITFRETLLLVDEDNSPFSQKQRVAEVIAHELVHQWFGNLVTMEWWTHLWLNESFATYMAYHVVDAIYPEWNYWTKFALDEQAFALQQDSLHATHPIEVPVHHPDEISEIFDAISYAKGASVLRMLENYIGADNFKKGLSKYLKNHSYRNTSSIYLWESFEKVSGLPVRKIMKSWTEYSGFPVVSVAVEGSNLVFEQREFKQLPRPSKRTWPIPLSLHTAKDEVSKPFLLSGSSKKIPLPESFDFINLDHDDTSLTVIRYDMGLLARLLPKFSDKTLGTHDRLALVRDMFLLAKSGLIPTDVYLETLMFTKNELSYVIWSEVAKQLNQLCRMTFNTKAQIKVEKFKTELFSQLLNRPEMGLKRKVNESTNNSLLRGLAFVEAGLGGNKQAVAAAKKYFGAGKRIQSVDVNLRSAIFATVARYGSTSQIGTLIKLYKQSQLAIEQQQILHSLIAGATDKTQKVILDLIYSEHVRNQDKPFAIAATMQNPAIKKQAWQRLLKHWPELEQRFSGTKMAGYLLSGAASFNSEAELSQFQKFLSGKKMPYAKQAIAQTIEKIRINIAWQKRDLALIMRYFR